MSLFTSAAGYANAVRSARATSSVGLVGAVSSVLHARRAYALGSHFHSLFDLANVPRSRWREFILDSEFNPVLQRLNREHMPLADDKLAFAGHCHASGLPTPPIICVLAARGAGDLRSDTPTVSDERQFAAAVAAGPDAIFIKTLDGAHGEHAFKAIRNGGRWCFAGQEGSVAELYSYCAGHPAAPRAWIVQAVVRPHRDLAGIMPSALGTIRAVTYESRLGPEIVLAALRIPVDGSVTDNFSGGRSGNLVAPIDPASGRVGTARRSRSRHWPTMESVSRHPDTGWPIEGMTIPAWHAVTELLLRAQKLTPQFRSAGWDIAVTDEGPLIVEVNPGYDIDLLQVAQGRGIRPDLAPIIALPIHRKRGGDGVCAARASGETCLCCPG